MASSGFRTSRTTARENERLAAVRRYGVLDTPPEDVFDRITALAARLFGVPISIISIVDKDRIWFKSHHGITLGEIERVPGLCASAILGKDPYIVADASRDPRSVANPLVTGSFGLRFYAGVPLTTADGHNLGTLCVLDTAPRPISQGQIADLQDLAALVVDQLEVRLSARLSRERADLMVREIDHRVMNSLQFVSGSLTMQSRTQEAGPAAAHLRVAANRVAAVAQVHRHFHADGAARTSCITFLRRLCADLATILDQSIVVSGDDGEVPAAWVHPIGLLVNELVTNAAKHGAGPIDVRYAVRAGAHSLVVCDEGAGLPAHFDLTGTVKGLGMRVVASLAHQLNGEVSAAGRDGSPGCCFTVMFRGNG